MITMLSLCFKNSHIEKILPPINNVYKTSVYIPLLGKQNIEYKRIKLYESEVRLFGLINEKGKVYINKENIYDYTFDEVLKKIITKYKCELNNPYYNNYEDKIILEIKIKLLKFGKKLKLTNQKFIK